MTGKRTWLEVGEARLSVSNLDKVMYPATGTTKGDVIAYYRRIAPVLTRHAAGRPATLKRWVHGVDGPSFFHKDMDQAPEGIRLIDVPTREGVNHHVDLRDEFALAWVAQLAALEVHVPQWRVDTSDRRCPADRMVFDLDPGPGVGLPECAEVARVLRGRLKELGFDPLPVTSGSKGIHLYCSLRHHRLDGSTRDFARRVAMVVQRDMPGLVVTDMSKALRQSRVLIDWSQNHTAKTTVAPYSLRGREMPTVAAPRTWREIASTSLRQLSFEEVLHRVARRRDPMLALLDVA